MTVAVAPDHDFDDIDVDVVGCTACRALATRLYPQCVADPYATALVDAIGSAGSAPLGRVAHGDFDPAIDDADRWLSDSAFIAARTRYFDDFALDACDDGIRQVVLLGSPLDARAYRLDWPADTVVFDVDQPPMITLKTRTMSRLQARPRALHRPVAVDVSGSWLGSLARSGFDACTPTAWIVEHRAGRLSDHARQRLFRTVSAMSAPHSRLAIDYLDDHADATRRLLQRLTWSLATLHTSELLGYYGLPVNDDHGSTTNRFHFVSATR
jgi:methyltransferase (TIGR00027 family)